MSTDTEPWPTYPVDLIFMFAGKHSSSYLRSKYDPLNLIGYARAPEDIHVHTVSILIPLL